MNSNTVEKIREGSERMKDRRTDTVNKFEGRDVRPQMIEIPDPLRVADDEQGIVPEGLRWRRPTVNIPLSWPDIIGQALLRRPELRNEKRTTRIQELQVGIIEKRKSAEGFSHLAIQQKHAIASRKHADNPSDENRNAMASLAPLLDVKVCEAAQTARYAELQKYVATEAMPLVAEVGAELIEVLNQLASEARDSHRASHANFGVQPDTVEHKAERILAGAILRLEQAVQTARTINPASLAPVEYDLRGGLPPWLELLA